MKQEQGQSLSEYVLASTLVAVVSIAALTSLNQEFEASLPDLLDRIFNGGGNNVASTAMVSSASASSGSGNTGSTNIEGLSPVELTLSDGSTITLTQYPTDISSVIETAGANGTTEILLANLEQVIQELLQAEEITPEAAQSLMNLANAGHEIASVQRVFENAIQNNPSVLDPSLRTINSSGFYEEPQVILDGSPLNITVLYARLGISPSTFTAYSEYPLTNDFISLASQGCADSGCNGSNFNFDANPDPNSYIPVGFTGVMNSFIQEYTLANENGSLDSPLIKAIIDDLSNEIIQINSDFAITTRQSNIYATDPNNTYSTETPEMLLNNLSSRTTNRDSGGICTTGGNADSGIQCQ